jgi:hypothetical protein
MTVGHHIIQLQILVKIIFENLDFENTVILRKTIINLTIKIQLNNFKFKLN